MDDQLFECDYCHEKYESSEMNFGVDICEHCMAIPYLGWHPYPVEIPPKADTYLVAKKPDQVTTAFWDTDLWMTDWPEDVNFWMEFPKAPEVPHVS